MIAQRSISVDEFIAWTQLPENQAKRYELIRGEIVEMTAVRNLNTIVTGIIIGFLTQFVYPRQLGYVTVPDGGFRVTSGSLLQPDAAFISAERAGRDLLAVGFDVAPDLAIEVISPSEAAEDVLDKTALYIESGSRLVWNVYPTKRVIHVCKPLPDGRFSVQIMDESGILEGGEVLPGFVLALRDVFAPLTAP